MGTTRLIDRRKPTWLVSLLLVAATTAACTSTAADLAGTPTAPTIPDSPLSGIAAASPATTTTTILTTTTVAPQITAAPTSAATRTTTTTAAASTVATTTGTQPPRNRSFTISVSGDILTHSPLWRGAERNAALLTSATTDESAPAAPTFDFDPMFAEIAPLVSAADLAICHLETPLAPPGEPFSTSPLYGVPREIVTAIAGAGFDRCSTASNHSIDRGNAGVDFTLDELDRHGIGHAGTARTPNEAAPQVFTVATPDGPVAVSHLSYTFSFNGLRLPVDEPWRGNVIDPAAIIADAAAAKRMGAEVVIVSVHWGTETVSNPTVSQRRIAEEITAPGSIDLVAGHHAHVLQPIEQVNDTWVAFGLGNLLSNLPTSERWPASSQDAALVEFEITVDADGNATVGEPSVHPTWVDKQANWVIRDVARWVQEPATADGDGSGSSPSTAAMRHLLSSHERSASVVGAFMAPIVTRSQTGG